VRAAVQNRAGLLLSMGMTRGLVQTNPAVKDAAGMGMQPAFLWRAHVASAPHLGSNRPLLIPRAGQEVTESLFSGHRAVVTVLR